MRWRPRRIGLLLISSLLVGACTADLDLDALLDESGAADRVVEDGGTAEAVVQPTVPDEVMLIGHPVDACFGVTAELAATALGAPVEPTAERNYSGFFPPGVRDPLQAAPAVLCRWTASRPVIGELTIRTGVSDTEEVVARFRPRVEFSAVRTGGDEALWQASAGTLWVRDGGALVAVQFSGGTRPTQRRAAAEQLASVVLEALRTTGIEQ